MAVNRSYIRSNRHVARPLGDECLRTSPSVLSPMDDEDRVTLTVEASDSISELFIGFRLENGERQVLAAQEPPAKVVLAEVPPSESDERSCD